MDDKFVGSFGSIDAAMSESLFSSAWREYKHCLIQEDDGVAYFRRPDEYIGIHSISGLSFPARFFGAAHGYFVGVGLLLTFIGLVAALKFAAVGVASPDVALAKQALNSLLSAASFKFMTSIAGLGCSLFLSIAVRVATSAVENSANGLSYDLQVSMRPIVNERLTYDQLVTAKNQLVQLEKFNTTFAVALAGELETRLGATLTNALSPVVQAIEQMPTPVVQAIDAMKTDMQAVNHDAMQHILEEFMREVRGSTGAELEGVVRKLAEVTEAISQTKNHIGSSGENFADQMTQAATRLMTAAETLQNGLDRRVDSVGDKLTALADALLNNQQAIATAATGAADTMAERVITAGDHVAQRMGLAASGLAESSATLSHSITERIAQLADALLKNQQALAASTTTTTDDIAGRMRAAGETVAASMGTAAKGLVETSDTLAQRITTILGGLGQLDAGVKSQLDTMKQVVNALNGAKQALDETATTWTRSSAPVVAAVEASRRTVEELARIVERTATAQRDIAEMAKEVKELSSKASSVWDNYRGRFEKVDEDMQQAFDRLTEGTRAFSQEVTAFMTKVDGDLAKGAQALSVGTDELREIAEILGDAVRSKVA